MPLQADNVGKGIIFQVVPFIRLSVHLSGQILLPPYLMNTLNSFDKTDRECSVVSTDNLVTL